MKIRRNQILRIHSAIIVNGHTVRTLRRLNSGAVKAEVVRASVCGGKVTRRWVPICTLGIDMRQLTEALMGVQKEVFPVMN